MNNLHSCLYLKRELMDFPKETNLSPLKFLFVQRGLFFSALFFTANLCAFEQHWAFSTQHSSTLYRHQADGHANTLDTESDFSWGLKEASYHLTQALGLNKVNGHIGLGIQPTYQGEFYNDGLDRIAENQVAFWNAYLSYEDSCWGTALGLIQDRDKFLSYSDRLMGEIEGSVHFLHMRHSHLSSSLWLLKHPLLIKFDLWDHSGARGIKNFSDITDVQVESFHDLNVGLANTFLDTTSFSQGAVRTAYAMTLGFIPFSTAHKGVSLNAQFLCAPFEQPYLVAVASNYGSDTALGLSVYNIFSQLHLTYKYYWDHFAFEGHCEYVHSPVTAVYAIGQDMNAEIFNQSAYGHCYDLSVLYHTGASGDSYRMDPRSGSIHTSGKGWIVGLGYGSKTQKNIFALMSNEGKEDFLLSAYPNVTGANRLSESFGSYASVAQSAYVFYAVDNSIPADQEQPYVLKSTTTPNVQNGQEAFHIKSKTFTLMLNYRFGQSIEWTNTLSFIQRYKLIFGQDVDNTDTDRPAYAASPQSAHRSVWRSGVTLNF